MDILIRLTVVIISQCIHTSKHDIVHLKNIHFLSVTCTSKSLESENHSVVSTVHGIFQVRILEWVAFPFSRVSFQHRNWTQVSRTAGSFFTHWVTKEAQEYWRRSVQFSSVQSLSLVWLCNPMNRSMPGLHVHHQLPESTQTHVHWVGDAI